MKGDLLIKCVVSSLSFTLCAWVFIEVGKGAGSLEAGVTGVVSHLLGSDRDPRALTEK